MSEQELEERVQRAVDNFMAGYGCCQSMVAAFADLYGLELDPAELEDSLFEDATEEMSFAKDNSKQTKLFHIDQ